MSKSAPSSSEVVKHQLLILYQRAEYKGSRVDYLCDIMFSLVDVAEGSMRLMKSVAVTVKQLRAEKLFNQENISGCRIICLKNKNS